MHKVEQSVYKEMAQQCLARLLERIEASEGARVHGEEVVELVSLQLFGPLFWNTEVQGRMRELLKLSPESVAPVIAETINDLHAGAVELSAGQAASVHSHYQELVASFQVEVTWYKLSCLRHKMGASAVVALSLGIVGLIGTGWAVYRLWRALHGGSPEV